MKLITSLFIILLFSSCGAEYVEHTTEHPFIIGKIYESKGKIVYSKNHYNGGFENLFAGGMQSITFDKDLGYRIGDTLEFVIKN